MSTLSLLVDNTTIILQNGWIHRWEFLSNLVSELGNNHTIPWTLSTVDDVKEWVKLNESMDESITDRKEQTNSIEDWKKQNKSNIILLSNCLLTVTYMMPTTGHYLSHCHVDDKIQTDRRKYFEESGKYVRTRGIRLPYATYNKNSTATHGNFDLWEDPAYGLKAVDGYITRDMMPDEMVEWILGLNLNCITGFMQNCYYLCKNMGVKDEDMVPWDMLDWKEVQQYMDAPRPVIYSIADGEEEGGDTMGYLLYDILSNSKEAKTLHDDNVDVGPEPEDAPNWILLPFSTIKSLLSSYKLPSYESLEKLSTADVDFFLCRHYDPENYWFTNNAKMERRMVGNGKECMMIYNFRNFSAFLPILLAQIKKTDYDDETCNLFSGLLTRSTEYRWEESQYIDGREVDRPIGILRNLLRVCWHKWYKYDNTAEEKIKTHRLICTEIANSLGTQTLSVLCEALLNDYHQTELNILFVETALKVIDRVGEGTGFQRWPILLQ